MAKQTLNWMQHSQTWAGYPLLFPYQRVCIYLYEEKALPAQSAAELTLSDLAISLKPPDYHSATR